MAAAVLTNVPTTITTCESITGWSGDTFILDAGVKVQGSNSVSCAMTTNGTNNIQYATSNAPGGQFDATGIHIRFWFYLEFIGNISSLATDGIQVQVISDAGTALYTISGGDVYDGGWVQAVVFTGDTPTSGSAPTTNCSAVGLTVNTDSKPRNVPSNCYVDAFYFGDGFTVTGGTSGDEIDWSHIAALDLTERYGIVTDIDGVYFLAGEVTIGTATTTWFKSGQKVQFRDTGGIASFNSTLFAIIFAGTGVRVEIIGGAIGAAGIQDYLFDASDTNIVSFTMSGVQFAKANSVLFDAGQTITTCVFDACGQVVPLTATFTGNVFANCTDTGGAVLFPSSDANIGGLTFLICDNGVEYDATSDATSPSFDDFTFDDAAGNYDVNNTSGSAVSIGNANGSNGNSYNPAGDIVTFLANPVSFTVTAKKSTDGVVIEDAQVNVEAGDALGDLFFEVVVTITSSGTLATVVHTAHGLTTGDKVNIKDAIEIDYLGAQTITVTGVNAYTYVMANTTTSPATGTITATEMIVSGLTDINGEITLSRPYTVNQKYRGLSRKTDVSPFYQTANINGTLNKDTGASISANLTSDE